MSLQGSDETQIPFHDASAYFSEEEWKLLQEWQKELYRNVMKEIHQALISLGPLIATTVGSVRAKEKEVLQPMDGQYLERRYRINHSPSDTMSNPEVRYRISKGEHLHLNNAHYSEGRKRHDSQTAEFPILSTDIHLRKEEEPASIFIDHIGEEIGESSTDPTLGHPVTTTVVSFRIKDEEETSCSMEHQDSKGLGTTSHSFSDGTTRSRVKLADSVKNPGKSTQCKVSPGRSITAKRLCSETETHYNIQLWSDMNPELEEVEAHQCRPGFSGPMHYGMSKGVPDVQTPEKNYEFQSDPSLTHNFTAPPSCTKQKLSLHSSNECENTLNNEYLLGHKATHADVRPYQCIECSKGFSKKANLFVHMRTHTGERPYHCNICDKSFNQRGILTRHQRTHLRERPY